MIRIMKTMWKNSITWRIKLRRLHEQANCCVWPHTLIRNIGTRTKILLASNLFQFSFIFVSSFLFSIVSSTYFIWNSVALLLNVLIVFFGCNAIWLITKSLEGMKGITSYYAIAPTTLDNTQSITFWSNSFESTNTFFRILFHQYMNGIQIQRAYEEWSMMQKCISKEPLFDIVHISLNLRFLSCWH